MKRKAIIIKESGDGRRCIAVDSKNADAIEGYLKQDRRHWNKFVDICNLIFAGLSNPSLYDKEEPDRKSKGVRAMKFFKGQENDRIYCKEITLEDKTFIVITAELLQKKKTQKLSQKERSIIHKVARYDYEIEDTRRNKESI